MINIRIISPDYFAPDAGCSCRDVSHLLLPDQAQLPGTRRGFCSSSSPRGNRTRVEDDFSGETRFNARFTSVHDSPWIGLFL